MGAILAVATPISFCISTSCWRRIKANPMAALSSVSVNAGELQHPESSRLRYFGQSGDCRRLTCHEVGQGTNVEQVARSGDRTDLGGDNRIPLLKTFPEQVCRPMAYAAFASVIHRDLKPSSRLLVGFGEVQVMDWGLAKASLTAVSPTSCGPKSGRISALSAPAGPKV